MARKKEPKKQEQQAEKPKRHEALEALVAVFDTIPRGEFGNIFHEGALMESYLRRGLAGLSLLHAVRCYFLDWPDLGGEECPFVKKIDELIPRDYAG